MWVSCRSVPRTARRCAEAQRRIELILDPPSAEVGAIYEGRVVNITKFGAFVNILPGRDGLIHISKLGQGKRIDRVEDVLSLGDELSVKVDDIDQNGKLSLSLVGDDDGGGGGSRRRRKRRRWRLGDGPAAERASARNAERPERERLAQRRASRPRAPRRAAAPGRETASFEAFWEGEAREQFGDLGPAEEAGRRPAAIAVAIAAAIVGGVASAAAVAAVAVAGGGPRR